LQLRRRGIKATRPEIKLVEFPDICIPIFSNTFQTKIEEIVSKAIETMESGNCLLLNCEKLLLLKLGMADFVPSQDAISIKSVLESFRSNGRLDAEYYHPKYDSYLSFIMKYSGGVVKVSDKFKPVSTPFKRKDDVYPYTEIGDINVGDGSIGWNYIPLDELPANAKIQVKKNDLLVSKVRPYRGAVAIISDNIENLIVSSAFCVLRQKADYPVETLSVLLRTPLYKDWLLKWNVGTSYPVIKDEDVLNMPLPLFESSVYKEVEESVQQSHLLHKQSENLLKMAKKTVEIAIEQGEEKALVWVQEKGFEGNAKL